MKGWWISTQSVAINTRTKQTTYVSRIHNLHTEKPNGRYQSFIHGKGNAWNEGRLSCNGSHIRGTSTHLTGLLYGKR